MKSRHSIAEAHRYIDNAKELLRDKGMKDNCVYQDRKYVKLARHAANTGILEALDTVFNQAGSKRKRKTIDFYEDEVAKRDRKMSPVLHAAYQNLHLYMGYDGAGEASLVKGGLEKAEQLIAWAEKHAPADLS